MSAIVAGHVMKHQDNRQYTGGLTFRLIEKCDWTCRWDTGTLRFHHPCRKAFVL
jgi:hypothetical protein